MPLRQGLENLIYIVRGRSLKLFLLFLLLVCVSLFESIGLGSLYPVIDILQDPKKISSYALRINSLAPFNINEHNLVFFLLAGIAILFIIKNLFFIFVMFCQSKFIRNLTANLQSEVLQTYLSYPYSFFLEHASGKLVQKQMVQTDQATSVMLSCINIARMALTILFVYLLILIVAFKIALVVTLVLLGVIAGFLIISRVVVFRSGLLQNELNMKSFGLAAEVISGIRQVKAFVAEAYLMEKFREIRKKFAKLSSTSDVIINSPTPILETIAVLGILGILLFMMRFMRGQDNAIPILVILTGGIIRMFPMISQLSSNMMNVSINLPCVDIVADLLRGKQSIQDNGEKINFLKELRVEGVSFAYGNEHLVLSDIHMVFQRGYFYGIAGLSGSGKSTLIDLLLGFYLTKEGIITVDGKDLKNLDLRGWRKSVGLISQDTFIFNGSVEDNIAFAIKEEIRDFERIIQAAKIADAHEFITGLDKGYKTIIGERGLKLSGGQRQRLAIARALYRDPDILIFDEATSSLDADSEKKVQLAIEQLSRKKTLIVIAHRLSTIFNADNIYVINKGRIVEEGTHQQLRQIGGLYASLCKKQGL